jgi:hypothetical protein
MGIYPSANWLVYTVGGSKLNTRINLNPGTYSVVVEEWDYCGGASTATVKVNVQSGSGVQVASPSNNSTVGSTVNFVATAPGWYGITVNYQMDGDFKQTPLMPFTSTSSISPTSEVDCTLCRNRNRLSDRTAWSFRPLNCVIDF